MKKYALLSAFLVLGCATYGKQAVQYAMTAWETLDETFFSWAVIQPQVVQYLMDQGKPEEAQQVYDTFKSAVQRWIKIKDAMEALLVKAGKEGELDMGEFNKLLGQARSLLIEVGVIRRG